MISRTLQFAMFWLLRSDTLGLLLFRNNPENRLSFDLPNVKVDGSVTFPQPAAAITAEARTLDS
jgi:hypothetical protein